MDKLYIDYYTAGIIDGEGTITMAPKTSKTGNRDFRLPIVSCSSTTREILDFLQEHYGGCISTHKVYKEHHKQSWSWKLAYNDAVEFCVRMHPLLLEPSKKERARMLATEYKTLTVRNGRYTPEQTVAKISFQERFLSL